MLTIYMIFLLLMTALLSSYITTHLPTFKHVLQRVLTHTRPKSRTVLINDLDARITELETALNNVIKRQIRKDKNTVRKIQEEVVTYLQTLQNDDK